MLGFLGNGRCQGISSLSSSPRTRSLLEGPQRGVSCLLRDRGLIVSAVLCSHGQWRQQILQFCFCPSALWKSVTLPETPWFPLNALQFLWMSEEESSHFCEQKFLLLEILGQRDFLGVREDRIWQGGVEMYNIQYVCNVYYKS